MQITDEMVFDILEEVDLDTVTARWLVAEVVANALTAAQEMAFQQKALRKTLTVVWYHFLRSDYDVQLYCDLLAEFETLQETCQHWGRRCGDTCIICGSKA